MRKVVLLFILFVFSLSRADAQEFHFIPRIGLNLANTYPESFADMRPGLILVWRRKYVLVNCLL